MSAAVSTVDDTYLSTDALVALAGTTRRQIDYWVRADYLHPIRVRGTTHQVTDRAVSGNAMRWPPAEVTAARLMARLVHLGFEPAAAAELARDPAGRVRVAHRLMDIEE